ncbi:MAG: TetR/AcrR family transcriptional regulator [Peptostreptococcaceae bacterium]
MEKINTRILQAQKTHNLIIETTLEMLKEKEYSEISINAICKNAKISVGALYHHFKSKEDIMYNIFVYIEKTVMESKENENIEAKDFKELIVKHLSVNIKYWVKNYNLSFLKQMLIAMVNSSNKYYLDVERKATNQIICILNDAKSKSLIKSDISSEYITERILTIYTGSIVTLCLCDGDFDIEKELENIIYPYLDSLK